MKKIKKVSLLADMETNFINWSIEVILENDQILLFRYPTNNWMSTSDIS